jgi:putative PEP-CTERM system histidine kinase
VTSLSTFSHALAAVCFAVLAALVLFRWRNRMQGSLLTVALFATIGWALVQVSAPDPAALSFRTLVAELAKDVAWILFLNRALAGTAAGKFSTWLRIGPIVIAALALVAGASATFGRVPFGFERVVVLSGLGLGLLGFVLVEQALRNTRASQAWAVKFLWFGVGGLFAYDVALFSASYVLDGVQPAMWAARGFAACLAVPLIALGVSRIRRFRPQMLMSQKFALYTSSVFVAGIYLLLVSIAGYYVRVLGGTWGEALQIVVVFGAILALVAVASSGIARARLRVFLAKHFFPYKYDYRTEWLQLTQRLTRDVDGSSLAERTADAFESMVKANGAAVWVLRDGHFVPAGGRLVGVNSPSEPADSPFATFLATHEWIVDLDRARGGEGRDADVPLPAWLQELAGAWLVIPLLHEQRLVAFVVLRRALAPQQLGWEDLDLLRTAGRQAASYFALEQAGDALARERQFAALNRFTAFLMHDLSNIVAQQRLMIENAARHKSNPEFIEDMISTIDNTVRRTGRLLDQLKSGETTAAPRRTRLAETCRLVVERAGDRRPVPTLEVRDDAEALVAGERFEHVLHHVVRNAQDATPEEGSVHVTLRADAVFAEIDVTDDGKGMDPAFVRERLFKPFDTTKGAKGMGIGAFQAREFARAAGGDVQVSSTPGSGTSFVIRLPRVE